MLKIATAKEMQQIDRDTIKKHGIAGAILMEKAGLAVVKRINETYPEKKIIVLCGGGNNGGDGFVIARALHGQGRDVKVFLSAKANTLSGDAKLNYDAAVKLGVQIHSVKAFLSRHQSSVTRNCLIVDALLGTGLQKEVRAPVDKLIKIVNKLKCPVLSVDIPSGISSDTGQIMGHAIKADITVTFGVPKRGHILYPGADHSGRLFLANIGFPKSLLKSNRIKVSLVEEIDILPLIPKRPRYSNKGTYGHVLLVAGSRGKTGASFMAAKACLRTGAGLVTIGVPETLVDIFQSRVTEEMILPLPDKGDGTLSCEAEKPILQFLKQKGDVIAIGPGISVDDEISKLVCSIINKSGVPVVLDADAINALSGKTNALKKTRAHVVLTPHPGEMARLLRRSGARHQVGIDSYRGIADEIRAEIESDRINTAISFAKKTKTYLVLKGVPTVIATPGGNAYINSTGNSGMATAGTGDVLTGMISALIGQGLTTKNAAVLGVYMHGLIGDVVAGRKGKHSLIASDIINAIPKVFKSIGS